MAQEETYAEVSKGVFLKAFTQNFYKPWCQRNMHGLHLLPLKKIIYLEQKNRRKKKKKNLLSICLFVCCFSFDLETR